MNIKQVRMILFTKLFSIVFLSMSYYIHLFALLPVLYIMMAFLSHHISASFLWNLPDAFWINRAGSVSKRTKSAATTNQIWLIKSVIPWPAIHVLMINITCTRPVIGEALERTWKVQLYKISPLNPEICWLPWWRRWDRFGCRCPCVQTFWSSHSIGGFVKTLLTVMREKRQGSNNSTLIMHFNLLLKFRFLR